LSFVGVVKQFEFYLLAVVGGIIKPKEVVAVAIFPES
jgi:hypothetical protein